MSISVSFTNYELNVLVSDLPKLLMLLNGEKYRAIVNIINKCGQKQEANELMKRYLSRKR